MDPSTREFNELMINVMIEDSQWLDAFQTKLLSTPTNSSCCIEPAACRNGEDLFGFSSFSLRTSSDARKRCCSEFESETGVSEYSSALVFDLGQAPGFGSTMKRAKSDQNLNELCSSTSQTLSHKGYLTELQADELPAPEFVKCNRSNVASETLRLMRSALASSTSQDLSQQSSVFVSKAKESTVEVV
jgi:hypothetical protein